MKQLIGLIITILVAAYAVSGQVDNSTDKDVQDKNSVAITSLKSEFGDEWNFEIDNNTGQVRYMIKIRPGKNTQKSLPSESSRILESRDSANAAASYIKTHAKTFGFSGEESIDLYAISEYVYPEKMIDHEKNVYLNHDLKIPGKNSAISEAMQTSPPKYNWIVDYKQKYNGTDVYGGSIRVVMTQDKEIYSIRNLLMNDIHANTTPNISLNDAIAIGIRHMNVKHNSNITNITNIDFSNKTKLNILPTAGEDYLAWIVEFGYPYGMNVFIDASNGTVIACISNIKEGDMQIHGSTRGIDYAHDGGSPNPADIWGVRIDIYDRDTVSDEWIAGFYSGSNGYNTGWISNDWDLWPDDYRADIYVSGKLDGEHAKINDGGGFFENIPTINTFPAYDNVPNGTDVTRDIIFNSSSPDSHGDRNSHVFKELNYGWWYFNTYFGHNQPKVIANTFTGWPTAFSDTEVQYGIDGTTDYHEIDDTLLHEYSHAVHKNIGGWANNNCPCTTENTLPICYGDLDGDHQRDAPLEDCINHGGNQNRCSCDAITEGTAEFWPANIYNEQNYETWPLNIDLPTGEKDEFAIARTLWGIRTAEGWGPAEQHIWAAIRLHQPSTTRQLFDALIAEGVSRHTAVDAFFRQGIDYNTPPYNPTSLLQYKSDGMTGIYFGGATNEGTVVIKGNISDPDEDYVKLDVEIRPVGMPFSNTTTCVSGPAVVSGSNASATCSGLIDGQFHWQARANDSYDTTGSWLSAGGNPESSPDVIVDSTLSSWQYNRRLNITGTTAGAQTNYQMKLTIYKGNGTDTPGVVYLGGNVRDDFGDLRFTKSDGVTLLDYWIESYTSGVSAVVWVEVDSIPASPGTTSTYVYYGNPSATSASSGENTFDFFDDFNDSIINQSKWREYDLNGGFGSATEADGVMKLNLTSQGSNPPVLPSVQPFQDGVLEFKGKVISARNVPHIIAKFRYDNLSSVELTFRGGNINDLYFYDYGYSGRIAYENLNAHINEWHFVQVKFSGNHAWGYVKNLNTGLEGYTSGTLNTIVSNPVGLSVWNSYSEDYFDDVRVRKYASPEPAWGT